MPSLLIKNSSRADQASVASWWATLDEVDRAEIRDLCDDRRDAFFSPAPDDHSARIPTVAGGRFLPHDDAWGIGKWGPDYFEYMLDHPEQFPIFDPSSRTLHIGCTRHADARACLRSGKIPSGYRCPPGVSACPMRRLVDAGRGRSVRLVASPGGRFAVAKFDRPDR